MYESLCFIIGFQIGYSFLKVRQGLHSLQDSLLEKPKPGIASTSSEVARIRQREESSFVIEPKTPQQVDYEESEELKKLNPGRF